jgi:hypothetical protein
MNFRLVLLLSDFGLAMGVASLLGLIPRGVELWLWLGITVVCAVWIAKKVATRRFLHGFLVGLISGMLSPLIQVAFFPLYLRNNPYAAESFGQLPSGMSPRLLILIMTPLLGLFFGLVLGCLAWLAGKVLRRQEPAERTVGGPG